MENRVLTRMIGVTTALLLNACATTDHYDESVMATESTGQTTLAERLQRQFQPAAQISPGNVDTTTDKKTTVVRGTGNFINREAAQRIPSLQQVDGEVTLNFELADIRDVIKIIFDQLGENYVLDPRVQGEVTVQTSRPLPKESLLPTLESLLKANGATLLRDGDVYKILPISEAVRGNSSPRLNTARLGPGYSVRIFPLRYISVTEMQTILQPFAPDGGILLADPVRNLLILAGTSQELQYLQDTIDIFDVNWLKGMSVGLYILQNIESQDMAAELDKLFGPSSELPLAGLFRFVPIDRLNAILVITPQAEFLNDVSSWIERLDGSGGERLYVYEVQYSDAEYLASLLNQIYEEGVSSSASSTSSGRVAPNRTATQISTSNTTSTTTSNNNENNETANLLFQLSEVEQNQDLSQTASAPADIGVDSFSDFNDNAGLGAVNDTVRVIADTENNSLLIWASAQNYDKILNALRKVDVPKRQVLIEATIVELSLTGDLRYGLNWFLNNGLPDGYRGIASFGLDQQNINDEGVLNGLVGDGFNYVIANEAGLVRAILDLAASDNKVKILSSPQLMVIDNQEASINVGDEQPVATSSSGSGENQNRNFQFIQTGVILEVKPQINAGGLVALDIRQEVSDAPTTRDFDGIEQPIINKREISSKVSIQSGQTLVLGGLIQDRNNLSQNGIPGLYQLPIVGPLFGGTTQEQDRRELVVLITPTVINNSFEAGQVTNELKERMKGVIPLESPWKTKLPSPLKQQNEPRKRQPDAG